MRDAQPATAGRGPGVIFRLGQILVALLAIGGIYVAYPYVTLYRLDMALRSGDVTTLQMLVDWPAVHEGITEDICDLVIDQSAESKAGSELPPFGAGFVRGITTNRVTERVTPQALVALAGEPLAGETKDRAAISVHWAFFAAPTQFSVYLRTSGKVPPTRLQMELRKGLWKITRIWLPLEMLGDFREQEFLSQVNRIHDDSEEGDFSETTLPTMARREPSRSIPLRSPQCATA
jgi:hypothetical protein